MSYDFSSYDSDSTPVMSRSESPTLENCEGETVLEKTLSRIGSGDKFFSLEFFPPRTKSGAINLFS